MRNFFQGGFFRFSGLRLKSCARSPIYLLLFSENKKATSVIKGKPNKNEISNFSPLSVLKTTQQERNLEF